MSRMKMVISVTRDHIARGSRGNCEQCPIALAVREQLPERAYVRVDSDLYVEGMNGTGNWLKGGLPWEADCFVFDFDCGEEVEPFSFEVELS